MIASDIAELYCKLGDLKETKKWIEAVLFSMEQNSVRTGIHICGYDIVVLGYSDYLGDIHDFDCATELSEATVSKLLQINRINCIRHLFYHIAWNAYEIAEKKPEEYASFRPVWEKAFRISKSMADFMFDSSMKAFLSKRESRYLS